MRVDIDLPLGKPIVHGYQWFTVPFAILGTLPKSQDWILSNFIHVAHEKDGSPQPHQPFDFFSYDYSLSPWLESVKVYRDWSAGVGLDPVDLCRNAIRSGYYLYLYLDDYYIPARQRPNMEHYSHDILVFGASDENRTFSVYGYDAKGILRTSHVGYDELRLAYEHAGTLDSGYPDIDCYKVKPESSYDFNFRLVRQSFEDYLNSTNVSLPFEFRQPASNRLFGMETYPALKQRLAEYLTGDTPYDIRGLQILWAHKRLMKCRVQRMAELAGGGFSSLVADCEALEELAFSLRNKMLFREMTGELSEFDHADIEGLDQISRLEQKVMESAIEEIHAVAAERA